MSRIIGLREGLFWIAALLLSSVIAISIIHFGMIQYGGGDYGLIINAGWKLHLGYQAYREVPTAAPPLFLLGCKWAFDLGGVNWLALQRFTAGFAVATFLAEVALLRRLGLGRITALLLSFTIQCISMILVTCWWFNSTTSVAAALFLTSTLCFCRRPGDRAGQIGLVMSGALLSLAKGNMAAPLLLSALIVFAATPRLRWRGLALMASAGILALAVLLAAGINPLDIPKCYSYEVGRAWKIDELYKHISSNDGYPKEVWHTFLALIPCVGALIAFVLGGTTSFRPEPEEAGDGGRIDLSVRWEKTDVPYLMLVLAGMMIAPAGMAMNNSWNATDLPIFLVGVGAVYVLFKDRIPWRGLRMCALALYLLSLVLLGADSYRMARRRLEVLAIGYCMFFEDAPLTRLENPPFFRGLHVGPRFVRVLEQMPGLLKSRGILGNPDARVYFGYWIEHAYAVYDIPPPRGLPLWWEQYRDTSKPISREVINRFKKCEFDNIILLNDVPEYTFTFMPQEIRDYLDANYAVEEVGEFLVYDRRDAPSKGRDGLTSTRSP